jgi:hypothetical protein
MGGRDYAFISAALIMCVVLLITVVIMLIDLLR